MAATITRSAKGMTLTELVVSALLMGLSMAAIGELVYTNTFASTKLTNKVDGQVECSRAIRRIAADVRAARIIGNVYAQYGYQNQLPDNSPHTTDIYAQVIPVGGWPTAWPAVPYKLGPQTLILQLPVYFNDSTNPSNLSDGIPFMLPSASIQHSPAVPLIAAPWVDTVVYQLVPDLTNVGTYQLQVARFTLSPDWSTYGVSPPQQNLRPPINPPQTVLTGITGPFNAADGTNQPAIFQYLASSAASAPVSPGGSQPLVGVSINIQVQIPAHNVGTNIQQSASHAEAYMRSATNLRMTN